MCLVFSGRGEIEAATWTIDGFFPNVGVFVSEYIFVREDICHTFRRTQNVRDFRCTLCASCATLRETRSRVTNDCISPQSAHISADSPGESGIAVLKPGVHTNDFAPIHRLRALKLGHASLATVFRPGRLTLQPILRENLESPVLRYQPITTAVVTDACLNTRWHHGAYTSAVLRESLGLDRVVTVYVA